MLVSELKNSERLPMYRSMIDDTDRAILRALLADGGLNAKQVGEAAGLSQPAAWRRIRRLEEAGVIRGRRRRPRPGEARLHRRRLPRRPPRRPRPPRPRGLRTGGPGDPRGPGRPARPRRLRLSPQGRRPRPVRLRAHPPPPHPDPARRRCRRVERHARARSAPPGRRSDRARPRFSHVRETADASLVVGMGA